MPTRKHMPPHSKAAPPTVLPVLLTVLLALGLLALAPCRALAGQIRESDLVISSTVGKVATSAGGDKAEARSQMHSVDITRGSQAGEVRVSGQADRVTTQAGGQNTSADSAVGGVSVGGAK
ncbi:MAG: hypothetical protein AB9900_05235 [Humidesulfovibrio sp.]